MSALLVVEDDQRIGSALQAALVANGHAVSWVVTGEQALVAAKRSGYDLVLLDLGLPDADGIDVCRAVKALQPFGVLVILTARGEEMDVVEGLESGADDYLVKPFRTTELLARVRAHLRRGPAGQVGQPHTLTVDDLELDLGARICRVRGVDLDLRPKEFDLLARLMTAGSAAVSRENLIADVWDRNWFGSTKTLDVHVAALRQRLSVVDPRARLPRIVTLRGFGYRLDPATGPSSLPGGAAAVD